LIGHSDLATYAIHSFAPMSGNNGALSVPHPKRIVTALSKLVDPLNTAEPIPSHKHAIELKWAAELANKQLGDAVNSPPDSRPSGDQSTLSTLPSVVVSTSRPRTNTNQSILATDEVSSNGEDSEDEPTGCSK